MECTPLLQELSAAELFTDGRLLSSSNPSTSLQPWWIDLSECLQGEKRQEQEVILLFVYLFLKSLDILIPSLFMGHIHCLCLPLKQLRMFGFPLINAAEEPLRILGRACQVSCRRRMDRGDKEGRRMRTKWSEIVSEGERGEGDRSNQSL